MIPVFTLDKEDTEGFKAFVPESVLSRSRQSGYYSMYSAYFEEDEVVPAGFLQFYICKSDENVKEYEAVIVYINVPAYAKGQESGLSLMEQMEDVLSRAGIKRISCDLYGDATEALKGYLIRCGYKKMQGKLIAADLSEVLKNPVFEPGKVANAKNIGEISQAALMRVVKDIDPASNKTEKVLQMINMSVYDPDLSSIYIDKAGNKGVLLIRRTPAGSLLIDMYSSAGEDKKRPLFELLKLSAANAKKICSDDMKVMIPIRRAADEKLFEKLCPDAPTDTVWRGIKMIKAR